MYIAIANKFRPFLEATVDDVSYTPQWDRLRKIIQVREDVQISGRIVQEEGSNPANPAQTMSNFISEFRSDILNAVRPRVSLYHDDQTISCFDWNPAELIDGPYIEGLRFPRDGADIFVTGNAYSFTLTAIRSPANQQSSGILEFQETVENNSGGMLVGHVGGIINPAEKQIFKEHEPWGYTQTGSAVGMYGYPLPPPPIWPAFQTNPGRPKLHSPEIVFPVPQRFRIEWSFQFEHQYPLPGAVPHIFYG